MKTHVEADLFVVPECDGGRQSPFFSGYRSQFFFGGVHNDCVITIVNDDGMAGGDTGPSALTFRRPELQAGRLSVGDTFCIAEGSRVVCRGMITRIHELEMVRTVSD